MKMSVGELQSYKLWRARTNDTWGFKITTFENKTFITGIYNDTPAEKAGVGLNEIIVTINRIPCEQVSHEYVYNIIRKMANNMTMVTRKATPEETQAVDRMTGEISIGGYYGNMIADNGIPESTEKNLDHRKKNYEVLRKLNYPSSKQKNEISSVYDAHGNHSDRHGHQNIDHKGDGNKGTKLINHEEKCKAGSQTLPLNGLKEDILKESKFKKRLTSTLEGNHVSGAGEEREHKNVVSHLGASNREDRKKKSRESREVSGGENSPKTRRKTHTNESNSIKGISGYESARPVNIENNDTKKSKVRRQKTAEVVPSERKTFQFINSKPTNVFDTAERKETTTAKEIKRTFPSMTEIRANLQAGKRRTLLLSSGDSFEDRVGLLNDL